MKILIRYERIPHLSSLKFPDCGKPAKAYLFTYSRKRRLFEDYPNHNIKPYPKGGKTTVILSDEEENVSVSGTAICSMSDTFSYKIGKELALLRATNLGLGHSDMNSGIMYFLDFSKADDVAAELVKLCELYKAKKGEAPNTIYLNPKVGELPQLPGITMKTSKVILENHAWIGVE